MLALLKQLHPAPNRKSVLAVAMFMGFVIALFLVVFQPFGLNTIPGSGRKLAILAGYGLITCGVVCFSGIVLPGLLPTVYAAERWTLGKDLFLLGLLNFAWVALINFFYTSWAFGFPFSWNTFLFSLFATVSVGFLPFTILVLYRHNRLLKQNLQAAASINAHIPAAGTREGTEEDARPAAATAAPVILYADAGRENLIFEVSNFLYAESADNYIKVTVLENGAAKTTMVRQTLKHLEDLLRATGQVTRCHRSYVVNLAQVNHAEGNAQGLKLHIDGCEALVPVSRSYVPHVRALLNTP